MDLNQIHKFVNEEQELQEIQIEQHQNQQI